MESLTGKEIYTEGLQIIDLTIFRDNGILLKGIYFDLDQGENITFQTMMDFKTYDKLIEFAPDPGGLLSRELPLGKSLFVREVAEMLGSPLAIEGLVVMEPMDMTRIANSFAAKEHVSEDVMEKLSIPTFIIKAFAIAPLEAQVPPELLEHIKDNPDLMTCVNFLRKEYLIDLHRKLENIDLVPFSLLKPALN